MPSAAYPIEAMRLAPTIPNGANVLVDPWDNQKLRAGNIYLLVIDGDVLLRRFNRRLNGSVELVCDNPKYPNSPPRRPRAVWPGSATRFED